MFCRNYQLKHFERNHVYSEHQRQSGGKSWVENISEHQRQSGGKSWVENISEHQRQSGGKSWVENISEHGKHRYEYSFVIKRIARS